MQKISFQRRLLLQTFAASSVLGAGSLASAQIRNGSLGRVIVIGGGYGGATAAKYLRLWSAGAIDVILIERNSHFVSCPLSNLVIGGSRTIAQQTLPYDGLVKLGIKVLHDEVVGIDPVNQTVRLAKYPELSYDRLVVSPGTELMFDQVQGFNAGAQHTILHAWKAGAQTVALRRQLEAMPNGGTYAISIPKAPYRCPPGPYERACQVAHYFKTKKTKSKVLILDGNEDVQSKKGLFTKVWKEQYNGMVEYRNNALVTEIDATSKTAVLELGEKIRADVLNIIPPQRAGEIAKQAGLITANNRWCGVDWTSMESLAHKNIHVLGDAVLAAPGMPKSGHMANQHGKAAAAAIVELFNGRTPIAPMMANTCYSFTDDKNVIHVASVHRYNPEKKTMEVVTGSGGLSSTPNELEGSYAHSWAQNIWADMLV